MRGEPIVGTPEGAFRCFMEIEIEVPVAGNCVLHTHRQDPTKQLDYKNAFDLD